VSPNSLHKLSNLFSFFFLVDSTLHLLAFTYKYPPFGGAHDERKRKRWYEQRPLFRLPYQFLIQAFHCAKTLLFCTISCLDHRPSPCFTGTSVLVFKSGSMASGLKLEMTLPPLKFTPVFG
jgi:hypothetical protein